MSFNNDDLQSEYYTVGSYDPNQNYQNFESILQSNLLQEIKCPQQNNPFYDITLSTTKMSVIHKTYELDSDSCYGQFTDIVERLPISPLRKEPRQTINKNSKKQMSPFTKSNWISQSQLKCIVQYQGKSYDAVVRINDTELVIVNGECRFKLEKITKIKALYQNYQKCLWITYEDSGKNGIGFQQKLKIAIQTDSRDDLYQLFSRIIVLKLTLLDYDIDMSQGDCEDVDRFMMAGEILKKSQYLGRWDLRKMIITDRIESFKEDICTFQISGIREIWTRFEVYKDFLVLKIRHGILKTEMALPIVNFNARFCKENWLYRIYQLVSASSI